MPISLTLGRHPNERMLSFYGVTPAKFLFELGADGREIDDRDWQVRTCDTMSEWGHRPEVPVSQSSW